MLLARADDENVSWSNSANCGGGCDDQRQRGGLDDEFELRL